MLVAGLAACPPDATPGPRFYPPDAATSDASGDGSKPDLPPQLTDQTVTIATWNVYRYFDTTCDSGACSPGDYEELSSDWFFGHRADAMASSIRGFGADIIVLQEVETQTCLEAIRTRLGPDFSIAELGEIGTPGSVDVGVVSRGTLLEVRTHRYKPLTTLSGTQTTFARELLEVHLDLDGWRVVVFAAHFKSKRNDDSERRLAEATAARAAAEATAAEFPDAMVVLGGDLNDIPGSEPLLALEDNQGLLRVAAEIPGGGDWTYSLGATTQAIDHLYLVPGGSGVHVPGSSAVIRTIGDLGLSQSDHAPLRAQFQRTQAAP